ncbi:MAG: cation:proton antiporter [Lactobacillales bacterium]|jgi:CPA1 family monovalent cation:H+ antiporter|nr:cation:proton antiporter [Lactobacillales bacterium]
MEIFYHVAIILVLVIATNVVYAKFTQIPLAFYQIIAGFVLSLTPTFHHYSFQNEPFLLFIIAPLLFNDGQQSNPKEIGKSLRSTISVAVFLAIFTVLAVGGLVDVLFVPLAFPLAFALAAIVTPTDSVAVDSITNKLVVPKRAMNTLDHESLFNDASGIVLMNVALATYSTGQFHLGGGIKNFLFVSLVGAAIGWILGSLIVGFRMFLRGLDVDENAVLVPYNLLTPFVVYLVAEHFNTSGILAAVTAGIVHAVEKDNLSLTSSKLQLVTSSLWDVMSKVLNGFVFVLLGLTIPTVWSQIYKADSSNIFVLTLIAVAVYLLMLVIRFLWLFLDIPKLHDTGKSKTKDAFIFALGGVHGTITLSMALSLPFTVNNQPFPFRVEIIYIVSIVVLISLIVPTVILGLILPKAKDSITPEELSKAQTGMVDYAMNRLFESNEKVSDVEAVSSVLQSQKGVEREVDVHGVNKLIVETQKQELAVLQKHADDGEFTQKEVDIYERVLEKSSANQDFFGYFKSRWGRLFKKLKRKLQVHKFHKQKQEKLDKLKEKGVDQFQFRQTYFKMESVGYQAAMDYLSKLSNPKNLTNINIVRRWYVERHNHFVREEQDNENVNMSLLIRAFQYEYTWIQQELAAKELSRDIAKELYEEINNAELMLMQTTFSEEE